VSFIFFPLPGGDEPPFFGLEKEGWIMIRLDDVGLRNGNLQGKSIGGFFVFIAW
jgi:hypothetical protein